MSSATVFAPSRAGLAGAAEVANRLRKLPSLLNRWARAVFWALALAVSLAVATSVMYRGGDHLVDIAGGAAMGGGALFVALVAEHVAEIVAQLRREKRGPMVVP
jgi:hypothetical protein